MRGFGGRVGTSSSRSPYVPGAVRSNKPSALVFSVARIAAMVAPGVLPFNSTPGVASTRSTSSFSVSGSPASRSASTAACFAVLDLVVVGMATPPVVVDGQTC